MSLTDEWCCRVVYIAAVQYFAVQDTPAKINWGRHGSFTNKHSVQAGQQLPGANGHHGHSGHLRVIGHLPRMGRASDTRGSISMTIILNTVRDRRTVTPEIVPVV